MTSQACLIGNISLLKQSKTCLKLARSIMDVMEAHLRAEPFFRITANVQGASPQEVSGTVLARPDLAGLQGPTIARVYNVEEHDWYSVSLLIKKGKLLEAVDHLRSCGAVDIAASQVTYLFDGFSSAFHQLFENGES
mgnify:CR=1 FL=1